MILFHTNKELDRDQPRPASRARRRAQILGFFDALVTSHRYISALTEPIVTKLSE